MVLTVMAFAYYLDGSHSTVHKLLCRSKSGITNDHFKFYIIILEC